MGVLFGSLEIPDLERPFTIVRGQQLIWQATQEIFVRWNQDMQDALSLFVQETTENFKERFKLPGNGMLQEMASPTETAAVKPTGSWDVAYPIRMFGASMAMDRITQGYMTMQEYENLVQTILNQNNNTVFYFVLKALFTNTSYTFVDPIHGSLTIQVLANTDGTLYPPQYGATAEAEENMYIGTSYAEAAISDANNPFKTIRDKMELHFGYPQGGSPITALVNTSTVPYARALSSFDEFTNRYLVPGANITTLTALPMHPQGARIVGVSDGVVIIEWPRIPAGFIIGLHDQALKPLKKRKDPADTGIGDGLTMFTTDMDHPYHDTHWEHRFGFGVGNRLGAVVVKLAGNSTYAAPTAYA